MKFLLKENLDFLNTLKEDGKKLFLQMDVLILFMLVTFDIYQKQKSWGTS